MFTGARSKFQEVTKLHLIATTDSMEKRQRKHYMEEVRGKKRQVKKGSSVC